MCSCKNQTLAETPPLPEYSTSMVGGVSVTAISKQSCMLLIKGEKYKIKVGGELRMPYNSFRDLKHNGAPLWTA